jgi:hypothetical protein
LGGAGRPEQDLLPAPGAALEDLVLYNIDEPSSLAPSILNVVELVEGQINAVTTNEVC